MRAIGTDLFMTRGDSETIPLSFEQEDGSLLPFNEGDILYFTVKENTNTEEKILQKVVTTFINNVAYINIFPSDTKGKKYMTYKYDIQITRATGVVTTLVTVSDFTLEEEVTYE